MTGLLLRAASSSGGAAWFETVSLVLWLVAFVALPGGIILCSKQLGTRWCLVLAFAAAGAGSVLLSGLVWKGSFGFYATGLALLAASGRRGASNLILVSSAAVSMASDARSLSAFAIAALLVTNAHRIGLGRVGYLRATFLAAAFVAGTYWAMLRGIFGAEIELRTNLQAATGNPILGARVEWGAAIEVAAAQPLGYGTGVIAPDEVQTAAVGAVKGAGGDYSSSYFTETVFGSRHDFHSLLIDLWFHFGPAGIAVGAVVAIASARLLRMVLSAPRCPLGALAAFCAAASAWDLLFSPMPSVDRAALTLALAALLATAEQAGGYAANDREIFDVARDDGSSSHDCTSSDCDPGSDNRIGPDPAVVANAHRRAR